MNPLDVINFISDFTIYPIKQKEMLMEKTSIQKVPINSQGYDDSGYYWGVGEPLYKVDDPSMDYPKFYRADSREDVKEQHSQVNPDAVYYR